MDTGEELVSRLSKFIDVNVDECPEQLQDTDWIGRLTDLQAYRLQRLLTDVLGDRRRQAREERMKAVIGRCFETRFETGRRSIYKFYSDKKIGLAALVVRFDADHDPRSIHVVPATDMIDEQHKEIGPGLFNLQFAEAAEKLLAAVNHPFNLL